MPFSDEGFVLESVSMKVLDDGELMAANLRSSWGRDSQSFRFACLLQLYDGKTMRFETQFQVCCCVWRANKCYFSPATGQTEGHPEMEC